MKLGQQDCARVAWDATRSWVRRLHALKVKVLTPKLATQAHTDWQMNAATVRDANEAGARAASCSRTTQRGCVGICKAVGSRVGPSCGIGSLAAESFSNRVQRRAAVALGGEELPDAVQAQRVKHTGLLFVAAAARCAHVCFHLEERQRPCSSSRSSSRMQHVFIPKTQNTKRTRPQGAF